MYREGGVRTVRPRNRREINDPRPPTDYLKRDKQIVRDQMSCPLIIQVFILLISEETRCGSVLTVLLSLEAAWYRMSYIR
jgi:hypothetical protein